MNTVSENKELSPEATELVQIINDVATDLMFHVYEDLPPDIKMKLSDLTRDTQRMLEDSQS